MEALYTSLMTGVMQEIPPKTRDLPCLTAEAKEPHMKLGPKEPTRNWGPKSPLEIGAQKMFRD